MQTNHRHIMYNAVVKSEQTAILKEICCLLLAVLQNEKLAASPYPKDIWVTGMFVPLIEKDLIGGN